MTTSSGADFTQFYRDVHGHDPYPWQVKLVERVLEDGWPDTIDVPTGFGKTSVLDVAVYTAGVRPSVAPRRIFLVVDRRLVVDAAYDHARRIEAALETARTPVLRRIAAALQQDDDDEELSPLTVTRMRGGVTWDRTWMEYPHAFGVITGTIDQIGSRILFRGYGVSPRARSIDAALTGTDSLILIDEAHLAEPFRATLDAAFAAEPQELHRRAITVTMSATTPPGAVTHRIDGDDRSTTRIKQILDSSKTLHMVTGKTLEVTPAMVSMAEELSTDGNVVLVVANTVARARAIFDGLGTDEKVLLTGRTRQPDRDRLAQIVMERAKNGRTRSSDASPFVIVATQTVEVGVDIDADHLITESAALSALVQRFGRLDRSGEAPATPLGIVVHDDKTPDTDPVYGPARNATWQHLQQFTTPTTWSKKTRIKDLTSGIPANVDALREITDKADDSVERPGAYQPVLFPRILDMWTRTQPAPQPDPPVAPYLHGVDDATAPVTVVWRSGLPIGDETDWLDTVARIPPLAGEGIDIPIGAVKAWLGHRDVLPVADIDGTTTDTEEPQSRGRTPVSVVVTGEEPRIESSDAIRPGMTIVVPVEYGGCDAYGWNPASQDPVLDVADIARTTSLRLGPSFSELIGSYHNPAVSAGDTECQQQAQLTAEAINMAVATDEGDADLTGLLRNLYSEVTGIDADEELVKGSVTEWPLPMLLHSLIQLTQTGRFQVTAWESAVIDGDEKRPDWAWTAVIVGDTARFASDDDSFSTSIAPTPITLESHQSKVADRARRYATRLGFSNDIVDAVAIAARLHDTGKCDPRFQAMLHHGDHLLASVGEPLAKSGMDPANRAAFTRARRLAKYPAGARHEELSARIAEAHPDVKDHPHRDLIIHLVASHHGNARPLMPPVADFTNPTVTIDSLGDFPAHQPVDFDHVDTFHNLNQTYGRWGLALLETIVRLADQTASRLNEGNPPHANR